MWPLVEAFSRLRWYKACERAYPEEIKLRPWYRIVWTCFELFGSDATRISHRFGEWEGVGKWRVYNGDE